MGTNRRSFLKTTTGFAAAALTPRLGDLHAEVPVPVVAPLDGVVLGAVAEAVLPESLGDAGRLAAVRAFAVWVAGYRPVSEEMHGYGDAEITYTAADPAPNWKAQLEALDLLARRTRRKSFGALSIAERREILRKQLAGTRGGALPSNPVAAGHVAVALLSFWATSSAAHDAAYGHRIMRGECRGLAGTERKPLPLAPTRTPS